MLLLVTSILVVLFTFTDAQCTPWSDRFEDYEYKLFLDPANYSTAQNVCVANGGYLATAKTESENNFVQTIAQGTVDKTSWLGLHRPDGPPENCEQACRDGWEWIDGSPVEFSVWANQYEPGNRDDGMFMRYDVASWFGDPQRIGRPFICKRDAKCTIWRDIYEGHEYKLFLDAANYNDAQEICANNGGYLVSANTESENNFVQTLAQRTVDKTSWLGLYRPDGPPENCEKACREGWEWMDGTAVDYSKWANDNEPGSRDDGMFMRYDVASWFGDPQRIGRTFICERDVQCAAWSDVFEDHEYKLFNYSANYGTAQEICVKHGGYLATSNSIDENNFIQSLARGTWDKTSWLGLYRPDGPPEDCEQACRDGWEWIDGSPVEFSVWANQYEPGNRDDGMFMRYDVASWFGDPQRIGRTFICERAQCETRCFDNCTGACRCLTPDAKISKVKKQAQTDPEKEVPAQNDLEV